MLILTYLPTLHQTADQSLFIGIALFHGMNTLRGNCALTFVGIISYITEETFTVLLNHEAVKCRGVMRTFVTYQLHHERRTVGLHHADGFGKGLHCMSLL